MSRFTLFAIALLVAVADRISKIAIERSLTALDSISVLPGWLRIIHTENPGAAFGILATGAPLLRTAVLIGISAVVLLFVAGALWNAKGTFATTVSRIGLSLVLGGALGNMYDRAFRGTVTDFIEVYHNDWSFPAFNVADSAITVGAALLLIDMLWPRRKVTGERGGLVRE